MPRQHLNQGNCKVRPQRLFLDSRSLDQLQPRETSESSTGRQHRQNRKLRNRKRQISPLELMKTSTMVTMNVPFVPARCEPTRKSGRATRVGRCFICTASKRGLHQQSNSKKRTIRKDRSLRNGDVPAVIFPRISYRDHIRAGVRRSMNQKHLPEFRHIHVGRHVVENGPKSVPTLVNSHVTPVPAHLVHTWARHNLVSVVSIKPPNDVPRPITIPAGVAERSAVRH
jgi:hypothetical protein